MSTSLEEMHELPLHVRVGRARAGVIMLIISDFMSILALLAAGGYLSTLNVLNQYKTCWRPSACSAAWIAGKHCAGTERTRLLLVGTQGWSTDHLHPLVTAHGRGAGIPDLAWCKSGVCRSFPCL